MERTKALKLILEGIREYGFTDNLSRFSDIEYYEWLLSTGIYRALLFRKDFIRAFIEFLEVSHGVKKHGLNEKVMFEKLIESHDPMDFLIQTIEKYKIKSLKKEKTS